jgi:transcriptional regulator with XRE-family HTH domain
MPTLLGMTRRRRGAERATVMARSAGKSIRQARHVAGLTRVSASARAGVARSTWDRIERGTSAVTLAALVSACDAVGLDLVCRTYPGRDLRLRDSGQLGIAQWLAAQTHPTWRVSLEEPAGDHGEAIDQVLWGEAEVIAVEIERFLLDWQSQFRQWTAKREWLAARHSRPVRLVIIVTDTHRNRGALMPFGQIVDRVLPARTRLVMDSVRKGTPLGSDGLAWFRERRAGLKGR